MEAPFDPNSVDTRDKFAELLLYVAKRSASDPTHGAVTLNKKLFYADFMAHRFLGKSITNAKYVREKRGPVPKPLVPVREALVAKGDAVVVPRQLMSGAIQKRLVPLREPDVSVFTPEELSLIDRVVSFLEGRRADEVSELSHDRVWHMASNGEEIPYFTVFLSENDPEPYEVQRGLELAKKYGWDS